ncbi:NEDD8-activating enzyme E1 regulatory subunit, putative [Entamoeba dispar SAW760]|uniref:NEDD8-activating enzyme E1 regulatory subunit n=1 Tax=Entamoeba dispar (strain ATCC PRA-260 / SAW760) TaxID=370354 RepID=B0EMF4_ENTDS|nr:NEDD8-activating enzyme E1 regulatory subunit, putative [Entamoeba dispar SAW760]EDR24292.1 NEDD8-activating enzyme E1 regulatory subunit, putative [Entamoeba dispar SAW760]|eukprot:EDR24292.1 NEDD8-activating enzyme E1 regulatory subunit, putative [Entamoeba dispar SAW760]
MTQVTDTQKYDRQLRLWGEIAQARLEKSKVLSIGSDCVASEFMKSIVLPGIGFIGIADKQIVSENDLETNFFIDCENLGQKRGECILNNLLELNDRVKGEYYFKSLKEILKEKSFIQSFDIIVCSNQLHEDVISLSILTKNPIIEVYTNGFIGVVKVYVGSHVIFDDGNSNIPMDLRVPYPFPKLQEFYNSIDIPNLNKDNHMHIPFPLILIWALNQWRKEKNQTGIPKSKQDKDMIKEIIRKQAFNFYAEENFQEALQFVFYCWQDIPGNVKQLLNDPRSISSLTGLKKEEIEFWGFIGGVKIFNEKNKRLPVDSGIKDMIASNEYFVQLQHVFVSQLEEDAKEVLEYIKERVNRDNVEKEVEFTLEMVKRHCKALRKMHVIDGVDGKYNSNWIGQDYLLNTPQSSLMYLAIIYASFEFEKIYQRLPCDKQDVDELLKLTNQVLKEKGVEQNVERNCVEQICRFGGVQIHTVNSVIGSFVGQEVIKYASHQFGALDNTFIFNTETGSSINGRF